jgi:heme-degrading monooxygenase HmoA
MEIVVIDQFVVPPDAMSEFLETSRKVQKVLKTLPGFLEGFVYEKRDGDGRNNVITTVVWQNEDAYRTARTAMADTLQSFSPDPQAVMRKIGIQIERGRFGRTPF